MIDLNYLAGFIDGEGWIGIYKAKAQEGSRQISDRYTMEVGIGQTMKGEYLFKELVKQFGGKYSFRKSKVKNAQDQCKYVVLADKALKLLYQIEPFLIIKKKQAEICRKFQESKNQLNKENNNFRGNLLPKKVIIQREKFYQAMKNLNKKGTIYFTYDHPVGFTKKMRALKK